MAETLDEKMTTLTKNVQDMFEIVQFIKDNAVSQASVDELKADLAGVIENLAGVNEDMTTMKEQLTSMRAVMVTKDYLDDKLADLRGDFVLMIRKEDAKVKDIVGLLHEKEVFTVEDQKRFLQMEPFAQIKC